MRVLGFITKLPTAATPFQSPWSEVISFENIVNTIPQIVSISARNSTSMEVEWIFEFVPVQFTVTGLVPSATYAVRFTVLYQAVLLTDKNSYPEIHWIKCSFEEPNKTEESIIKTVSLTYPLDQQKRFWLVANYMQPNTTYAIAVYGTIWPRSDMYGISDSEGRYFTLLSETSFQSTPQLKHSFTVKNFENDLITATLTPANTQISKVDTSRFAHFQYPTESHVLIVILGSLAGVLLVISLALIALCLWCQLRAKRRACPGESALPLRSSITGMTVLLLQHFRNSERQMFKNMLI
ncbi:hypothetical protein EG68_02137 [Paragonimus skrjabini miyazakii]|uniref:Uncharacterized protein n=1 Tax=Paragonimus skrjabini miyazakii TaxID=59628 RepID=A0A8S9Z4K8_9TREM|nr:hypothetical protein EG68_02137 [Paragonimus skrjabini miyazakii]